LLFLATRTPAIEGSFGSMSLTYIHPLIWGITLITDQIHKIAMYLKSVENVHCLWHRRQNTIKMCGGGGGKIPYSALWMYNKLVACSGVGQVEFAKGTNLKKMDVKDVRYLNSLPDASQYPTVRCANFCMYHCLSSSLVEAMNVTNKQIRARTAVDLLNGAILLITLECSQFLKHTEMMA
jgi:hypothetical protein